MITAREIAAWRTVAPWATDMMVEQDYLLCRAVAAIFEDDFFVEAACKGPRGAFRISYEALAGRYLRQDGFLDLVRSGYIGAYAKNTSDLANLIQATLKDDRAVVAAVQSALE